MAAGRGSLAFAVGLALVMFPRFASGLPSLMAETSSEPRTASGSLFLSVRGAYRTQTPWGRELVGLVELNVPLDRFVAQGPANEDKNAQQSDDETQQQAPAQALVEPPKRLVVRLTPALARDAVRAALRAAGDHHSRVRLASIASRARSSAVLPELRLRAAHSTDQSLRLSPTESDPYRYTRSGGADLALEARLTWKLDRLVFADQELGVERLRSQRAAARARLAQEVLRALFAWQRAELRRLDPELSPDDRADAALRALEALVTLDVLTGGWFGEELSPRTASASARGED